MDEDTPVELPPEQFGLPRADVGKWASCIRVVNPLAAETLSITDLDDNEAAFCIQTILFPNTAPGETFIVVGTAKDVILSPRQCSSGFLRTYKMSSSGTDLELVHVVSS